MALDEEIQPTCKCPKCGHLTKKSLRWLETNDSFVCEGCGATGTLTATAKQKARSLATSVREIEQVAKNFGAKRRR